MLIKPLWAKVLISFMIQSQRCSLYITNTGNETDPTFITQREFRDVLIQSAVSLLMLI